MQILINWALMDQSYGRRWESFLGLDSLCNVTKLLRVFLIKNLFSISNETEENKNLLRKKKNENENYETSRSEMENLFTS